MADHGTRQCYADGCRQPECKAAQAQYMREWKARKSGAVVEMPTRGRPRKGSAQERPDIGRAVGEAEQAVLEELETLSSAATRKSAVAAALAMARILDNPLALTQQASAAGKLLTIMEELRKGSGRSKGRLASVQAMTKATG